MSGHTPGPWEVVPRKYDGLAVEQAAVAGQAGVSRLIARLNTYPPGRDHKANARLIAVAPELLALLTQLRDDWFEPHYGTNDVGMGALLRDKIRAAIAKAQGR